MHLRRILQACSSQEVVHVEGDNVPHEVPAEYIFKDVVNVLVKAFNCCCEGCQGCQNRACSFLPTRRVLMLASTYSQKDRSANRVPH